MTVPIGQDRVDYLRSDKVEVFDRGIEPGVALVLTQKIGCGVHPGRRHRVIAASPHHKHPVLVRPPDAIEIGNGLQNAGVLHGRSHEFALARSPVIDPFVCPVIHQLAVPEGHCRKLLAFKHERRLARVGVIGETHPLGLDRVAIGQLHVFRQRVSPRNQFRVDCEHFSAGRIGRFRSVIRALRIAGEIAEFPILGNFARVYLMRQIAIDDIAGPGNRSDGRVLRIDSGDTGHQPVGAGKIEPLIQPERHRRRRGACRADARDHTKHLRFGIVVKIVEGLRKGDAYIKVAAVLPQLEFTGRIAFILANLEQRNDHDLYGKRVCTGIARLAGFHAVLPGKFLGCKRRSEDARQRGHNPEQTASAGAQGMGIPGHFNLLFPQWAACGFAAPRTMLLYAAFRSSPIQAASNPLDTS